mmetsp:Transcript_8581/g.13262  ORF Transcript_8581/g.13262 Transcript_8581/m.13262 type:complete len:151 (+) Transcript_8581:1321-1773(+)
MVDNDSIFFGYDRDEVGVQKSDYSIKNRSNIGSQYDQRVISQTFQPMTAGKDPNKHTSSLLMGPPSISGVQSNQYSKSGISDPYNPTRTGAHLSGVRFSDKKSMKYSPTRNTDMADKVLRDGAPIASPRHQTNEVNVKRMKNYRDSYISG